MIISSSVIHFSALRGFISSEIHHLNVNLSFCWLLSLLAIQTEVTTVICGPKELKKLIAISGQLDTVKSVIYMNEEGVSSDVSSAEKNTNWKIIQFEEVVELGKENPADADLPASADIAVIMYTSGSTGVPKVRFNSF